MTGFAKAVQNMKRALILEAEAAAVGDAVHTYVSFIRSRLNKALK